jgi:oleate hydratase
MEAVYTLTGVDRGVPEVFASSFDIRVLLSALYHLNDRKPLHEVEMPLVTRLIGKAALSRVKGTYIEELLAKAKLI